MRCQFSMSEISTGTQFFRNKNLLYLVSLQQEATWSLLALTQRPGCANQVLYTTFIFNRRATFPPDHLLMWLKSFPENIMGIANKHLINTKPQNKRAHIEIIQSSLWD